MTILYKYIYKILEIWGKRRCTVLAKKESKTRGAKTGNIFWCCLGGRHFCEQD